MVILLLLIVPSMINGKTHMIIGGKYLFYSYDHNYIFGRGEIVLKLGNKTITGELIEINVTSRIGIISIDCRIVNPDGTETKADMAEFSLKYLSLSVYSFGEQVEILKIPEEGKAVGFVRKGQELLKGSLLYFVGRKFTIKKNLDIIGQNVTIFVEGGQSLSFRKFRMNRGLSENKDTFNLNNLWYYNTTGIRADLSMHFEKKGKNTTLINDDNLKLKYDIFNKNPNSPQLAGEFRSKSRIDFSNKGKLKLEIGHITGNMTDAMLNYSFKPGKTINSFFSLYYKNPDSRREEFWFMSNIGLNFNKLGKISVRYNIEKESRYNMSIIYSNRIGKSLNVSLGTDLAKVEVSDSIFNKLSNSNFSLSYSTKIFNLSADYSLNRDLLHENTRSSPRVNLNFTPFRIYGGLLNIGFSSSFVINTIKRGDMTEDSFRSNTSLMLNSEKLSVTDSANINFSLRFEQFIDKDPLENFTSAGVILKGEQKLSSLTAVELLYNYYSRRSTRGWLIAGTSSGDVTALFKTRLKNNLANLWCSLSYNIAGGNYTSGLFNININLFKNWKFHTMVNHNFEFDHTSYILYLDRKAGRILLRASYRSLSKQFLIEVIPN